VIPVSVLIWIVDLEFESETSFGFILFRMRMLRERIAAANAMSAPVQGSIQLKIQRCLWLKSREKTRAITATNANVLKTAAAVAVP
jgi:hypothetical protein